jgi:hypothetical protein
MLKDNPINKYCDKLRLDVSLNERILFVQTPQVILDSFNRDIALANGYYIFPPTGIQYLCDSIKHRNMDIQILDLNFEVLKRAHNDSAFNPDNLESIFKAKLKEFKPSIVCVSCLFDVGISAMLEIISSTREEGNALVIGGGVIATYESERLLSEGLCHFVIEGEGENKLNYLLDVLYEKDAPQSVPGIHFNFDGECRETKGTQNVVNIVGDLIDTYELIDISEYSKYGSLNPFSRNLENKNKPFAAIQLGRGCRAACSFCAVRDFMGKGVRFREHDDIIKEMAYLIEHENVQHFELLDDDPTFSKTDFNAFCREIIDRKWNIAWSASNGIIANSIDEEMLKLIRDSGCVGFAVGVESGNKEMLKKVMKPGTHKSFLKFGKMLDKVPEVFVKANYIVGLPEENFGQILDSFWFSLEDNMDWEAFTVCQIIRGASAFSDSGEYFESQMKGKGKDISNFIPTRNAINGQFDNDSDINIGMDIFSIDRKSIPSEEQVKEIWFAFNIISNYIFNKNLSKKGRPSKFINWVERVRIAYPTNPNMNIFLAYAYMLNHEKELAQERFIDAQINLKDSEYWMQRIASFGLENLYYALPSTANEVHNILYEIRNRLMTEIEQYCGSSKWDSEQNREKPTNNSMLNTIN